MTNLLSREYELRFHDLKIDIFTPFSLSPLNFDLWQALRDAGCSDGVGLSSVDGPGAHDGARGHTGGRVGAQRVVERDIEGAL